MFNSSRACIRIILSIRNTTTSARILRYLSLLTSHLEASNNSLSHNSQWISGNSATASLEIAPCTSFEQPLHFHSHTWNVCHWAPNWYNDTLCLKSVERMIKANKVLSPINLNSTLYCLNMAFPYLHSYIKSYFGPIYLSLQLCHIFLRHSVQIHCSK